MDLRADWLGAHSAPLFPSYVILGKLLNLSVPCFTHLKDGSSYSAIIQGYFEDEMNICVHVCVYLYIYR